MIYGVGSIIPRVLNYLVLTPFYTYVLTRGEYGTFSVFYSYTAFLLVLLTFGMETTFFRFSHKFDYKKVASTAFWSVTAISLVFLAFAIHCRTQIAVFTKLSTSHISYLSFIVFLDVVTSIPLAVLRRENRAKMFAIVRVINVVVTLSAVYLLLSLLPDIYSKYKIMDWLYNPSIFIDYAFLANIFGSLISLMLLLPVIFKFGVRFDFSVLKKMLIYTWPLLIVGLGGAINSQIDKLLLRNLLTSDALSSVGVYSAGFKIAMLLSIFIQMFKYAAEPFFFSLEKDKDKKRTYSQVMTYFTLFSLFIFLGILLYIDFVKFFIGSDFREGLVIVPILLFSFIFQGIYYNLAIWYKLTNKTHFGAIMTIVGSAITLVVSIIFIPIYGYIVSAWASLACYLVMTLVSYILGQRYFYVEYETKKIVGYIFFTLALYYISVFFRADSIYLRLGFNTILIFVFLLIIYLIEIRKFIKQKYHENTNN